MRYLAGRTVLVPATHELHVTRPPLRQPALPRKLQHGTLLNPDNILDSYVHGLCHART